MAAHPAALLPFFALLLLGAALPADRAQLSSAKLASSTDSRAVPKLRGGDARAVRVQISAAALNASTRAETEPALGKQACRPGQNVYAPYGATHQYYGAVISRIGPSGEVEVDWYNADPHFRSIEASRLYPPCVAGAPTLERPATPPAAEPAKASPTAAASTTTAAPTVATDLSQTQAPTHAQAQATAHTQGAGMLHFLFLVNDQLPHLDLWRKWFASAPAGQWTAKVHCKDPDACRYSGLLDVPGLEMVETTPTYYCHDLVTAMARLLSTALADSQALPGTVEKFVFVSDSTLPVKPFHEVQAYLLADNDSDFCLFPRDQWATATIDGHNLVLAKHHQWVVLNRPHAELFVREWVPVDSRGVWHVWLRGGSWAGNERFLSPQHFHRPPKSNTCADEWAFVATIFGAIEPGHGWRELTGFGGGAFHVEGSLAYTTQGRCRTFTFWDVRDGPVFAKLAGEVNQDWGTSMSCYPHCTWHPAKFDELSTESLTKMRHSEFLFVRKLSPWISLPTYQQIVIR